MRSGRATGRRWLVSENRVLRRQETLAEIRAEHDLRRRFHADECIRGDHPLGLDSLRRYFCIATGDHHWRKRRPDDIDALIMSEHDAVSGCWKCGVRMITEAGSA